MCQRLMANLYDFLMQNVEKKSLGKWRKELLQKLSGDVLEIGSGTAVNLEYYPNTVSRLVLSEPNPYMQQNLRHKVFKRITNIEIVDDKAESLSFADASFDAVVSTLVLCSVSDLEQSLAEMYRVLKPNGIFVFIEHVAANKNSRRYLWQHRLDWIWHFIAQGCHVTRETEKAITAAGFTIKTIEHESIRGVPPIVRPSIRGVAIKE